MSEANDVGSSRNPPDPLIKGDQRLAWNRNLAATLELSNGRRYERHPKSNHGGQRSEKPLVKAASRLPTHQPNIDSQAEQIREVT